MEYVFSNEELADALEVGLDFKQDGKPFTIAVLQRTLDYDYATAAHLFGALTNMGYVALEDGKMAVTIGEEEIAKLRNA